MTNAQELSDLLRGIYHCLEEQLVVADQDGRGLMWLYRDLQKARDLAFAMIREDVSAA